MQTEKTEEVSKDKTFEKYENLSPTEKKNRLRALGIGGGGLTTIGGLSLTASALASILEKNHKKNPLLYKNTVNPETKKTLLKFGIPLTIIGATGLGLRSYHKYKDKQEEDKLKENSKEGTKLFALNQVEEPILTKMKKKSNSSPQQSQQNKKPQNNKQLQLATMRQQNENLRHQRAIQKMQLDKQKMGLRGQLATQKKLQDIKSNQIRVKKLELDSANKSQMNLFKAKPKSNPPLIVSM